MARDMSVTLDEHFETFVEERVDSGRYGSASDVIRAGLHLLEDYESRLDALRAELIKGEMSGTPAPLDIDEFLAEMRAEWQR